MELKLAKELLKNMSAYFKTNRLSRKLMSPINEEYIEALRIKPMINFDLLDPAVSKLKKKDEFETAVKAELKRLEIEKPNDLIRFDIVLKGTIFLYLNEILSWKEVRFLLNLDYVTGSPNYIHLYKKEVNDSLGAYDVVMALLSVLFGKVVYEQSSAKDYKFSRLTTDKFYWDLPVYYFGYKSALSYNDIDDLKNNINWFIDENPTVASGDNPYIDEDILGMMRINNSFSETILKQNNITDVETELDNLPLYNISLNILKFTQWNKELEQQETIYGMGNVLFDYYKAIVEKTMYTEDDEYYTEIKWEIIEKYCSYIRILTDLRYVKTILPGPPFVKYESIIEDLFSLSEFKKLEKVGFILREIQNFLIH